jgi:hypothetical protein
LREYFVNVNSQTTAVFRHRHDLSRPITGTAAISARCTGDSVKAEPGIAPAQPSGETRHRQWACRLLGGNMRFRRSHEALPDISKQLNELHEPIDASVDDTDEQIWERENPAKVIATKTIARKSLSEFH